MKKAIAILVLLFTGISPLVFSQNSELKWYTIEEALKLNEKNPKKLFIDVYTDWCGWCKVMDKNTFSQSTISQIIDEYYYAVKFDAEQKTDIEFNGKAYKFVPSGRRGYHELAYEIMGGKMSYPTVVYMDEELNIIQAIPGYYKPEDIEPILMFFGSDSYKTVPWEDYKKDFKSRL